MKRLIQIVAIFTIGFLVVQPALASLPCSFGTPVTCVSGCPMAMSGMSPDCPMTGMSSVNATDCPQNCCSKVFALAMAPPAVTQRLRLIAVTAIPASPMTAFEPDMFRAQRPLESRTASPPRYILLKVFRI
jgi:hypothetical protein